MVLNMGPLDWESGALTTRPLLHKQTQTHIFLGNQMKILFSMVNSELSCANKKENMHKQIIYTFIIFASQHIWNILFYRVYCCELLYTHKNYGTFVRKGFWFCMLSSWERSWKKNERNIFSYEEENGYGKVNIFQCLFLLSRKFEFLWNLLLQMKKTGNFAEFIFPIQCFFGIRFWNFGANLQK